MNIQFKKGVLELCVLSLLYENEKYGYELTSILLEKINISDGTIYPLLRRLKQDGYVNTYIKESKEGPARKYYQLTALGKKTQIELKKQWLDFVLNVDDIIKGGAVDE